MATEKDTAPQPIGALLNKIQKMEKRATGKISAQVDLAATHAKPHQPAQVIHLPLWPESVRGVPNGFLRSALFGAIAKGKRRYIDGEQLAALDGIEIRYTGQRLDQGDLDVTLHRLCGSEAKRMSDYKIDLRKNLDAVADASAAHGEGFSYEIRGDLVYVEKKACGPQRRHLAKKGKR